jgi:hypothetical protein
MCRSGIFFASFAFSHGIRDGHENFAMRQFWFNAVNEWIRIVFIVKVSL